MLVMNPCESFEFGSALHEFLPDRVVIRVQVEWKGFESSDLCCPREAFNL